MNRSHRNALRLSALLAALLALPGLGRLDLWAPDEPRIAQVAEELRSFEHGLPGLAVLHLNGEAYTQKPPLYYWLAALVGAPSGRVSEAAARLPSALAAVACAWLTAWLALALFPGLPRRASIWAAIVLVTGVRFTQTARRAQLDGLLTLCETAAIAAFASLPRVSDGSDRPSAFARRAALLCAALGCGLLVKGPVALLPLASIALFCWWESEGTVFRRLFGHARLALVFAPVLAWLGVVIALAPAGFAAEALGENLIGRFFRGTSHARPFWYYAQQWPIDFLPWTPVALLAGATAWRAARGAPSSERRAWRLLVAWAGVQLVFFTLSAGKRGLYLLPIAPAFAIASAVWLERNAWSRARLPVGVRFGLGAAGLVVVATGAAVAAGLADPALESAGLVPGELRLAAVLASTVVLAAGVASQAARRRAGAHAEATAATAGWTALLLLAAQLVAPAVDAQKSPRPAAQAALRIAGTRPIGLYQQRATLPGLAYYARRTIEPVASVAEARAFWARGGGALVLRSRQLEEIDPHGGLEVRARLRRGRRELLVVAPAPR